SLFSVKSLILRIKFLKPIEVEFGILFYLQTQHMLVDGIIQSRAFTLQIGKPGDKPSMIEEKIMIEVPELEFDEEWDKILLQVIKSKYKVKGNSKKQLKQFALAV